MFRVSAIACLSPATSHGLKVDISINVDEKISDGSNGKVARTGHEQLSSVGSPRGQKCSPNPWSQDVVKGPALKDRLIPSEQ